MTTYTRRLALAVTFLTALATVLPASAQRFTRTDLTANGPSASATAPNPDANLVNAWGLSRSSTSPWWVSDNGKGLSTLYDGTGAPQKLVVTIPPPKDGTPPSAPTGTVFNPTTAFQVAKDKPAIFLFATEDGTVAGWNPQVQATTAINVIDPPKKGIYKGLALAQTDKGPRLYVTNFKSGRVEVYDGAFQPVRLNEDAFHDRHIGESGEDWAPFGIQNVGGSIVVTFARRERGSTDEQHGPGLGRVAVFDTNGRFILELQHGPWMNAPWGIALAPGDFGAFSHRILIGNFGDGTIHAFNVMTGRLEGQLLDATGQPLTIDGLWAISFGNGRNGLLNELFFTAGPNDENDGLLGKLSPVATEQRGNSE